MVAASSETDPAPSSADSQAGGPQKSASATEIAIGAGNPLKKKIDRLISSKLHNDANFIKVVDYVGPLVDQLDIHIERRLRRQLEQREIELNKEYLKDFEQMNQNVQTFVGKVREMHRISSELTDRIQQNKDKTKDLLNKTSALQSHKRLLEAKQRAIDEFLDKFSISETERKALHGNPNDGTVSMEFFPALERVKTIYEQSKQLLRTSQDHSAAIEIMDEMGKLMSDAYITLQASASRECRLLSTDYSDVKGVLCRSLAVLQERYGLLKHTLDEYATGRKGYILKYYIDALIKGAHRNGRPIELMSHDSLRYIGDMLAWIYEAIESERELLQFMLKDCKPEAMQEHGTYVLSEISSALNAPLKTRVEQSMNAEQNCVTLYRLSALFNFYAEKLSPIIGADSQLARTIVELNELALNLFFSSLSSAVRKLLTKMGAPDYDLLPVPAVHQVLLLLRDILDTHDGAMTSRSNAQEEFQQIFTHVLDPLHNAIQIAATHLHSPLDIAVYTLNCLTAINSLVTLYQFTDRRLEMLKASMEANEDVLVSEEASNILASTGLVEIYRKAAAHDTNQGPLSAIPSMDPASIMHALNQFDSFLARPDSCRLDQVAKISSARIRDLVRSRTMENVIAAYSTIHRKLVDPPNKYENINYKSVEQRQQRQNLGVYLLAYQLMTAGPIPPVTLGAIALQVAIYLGFIPALDLDKTRSLCLIPYRIIQKGEWIRLLAPIVMHADDMHLYYNMASLLWKGRKLENWMGSVRFASVLAVLSLASSATAVLLSFVLDGFLQSGYSMQCAVGFSGVLFALKVLVSTYLADEDNYLFGWMPIPSKYVAWAELVLIQAITPNASFVGHLAGILAGLMYTYGPLRVLSDIVASPFLADGQNRRGPTAPRYENDDYDNVNDRPDERAFRGGAGYARRDDFNEFTGGFSEGEQIRRAMEESRRYQQPNQPYQRSPYGWNVDD